MEENFIEQKKLEEILEEIFIEQKELEEILEEIFIEQKEFLNNILCTKDFF